ncbi:hypothetical protein G6F66_015623 [Rhizopus arrhizus]|nr:hypothetical protein G6F66_015623 [Rhizopus arrhizus]KAG1366190.1 hypothetical protein G6F59_018829 [Rhizopus arrhizus]
MPSMRKRRSGWPLRNPALISSGSSVGSDGNAEGAWVAGGAASDVTGTASASSSGASSEERDFMFIFP